MHEHERWLDFATQDMTAATRLVNDPNEPLVQPAIVLAQQAAEKALKYFLLSKGHPALRTHDLVMLVGLCTAYDQSFDKLLDAAESLNPHISASRYPDSCFMMPDLITAKILIEKAKTIYDFVNNLT